MKTGIAVDTDVLIDFQRGDATAAYELALLSRNHLLAVSTIVQLELLAGSANKIILNSSQKLLQRFQILSLTSEVGETATQLITNYKLSQGLPIADALIAATALEYDLPLFTKNQRDFRFIPGLKLLPYPSA